MISPSRKLRQRSRVAFLLIAIGTLALTARETSADEPFQVMSYNIRYLNTRDGQDVWSHRSKAVIATIERADIVGLQEVVAQQFEEIREATGSDLAWYGVGRDDGKHAGEATPIGWRKERFESKSTGTFWLSPEPDRVASKGWDAALPRIASWVLLADRAQPQIRLLAVNTHFDHRGRQARKESAKLLRVWIHGKCNELGDPNLPVVLTGDFNATLESAPIQTLLHAELHAEDDSVASSSGDGDSSFVKPLLNARTQSKQTDPGPDSTWNGFQKIVADRRIDFILLRGTLKVERFETLDPKTEDGRFASDHLPIQAQMKLESSH